jgi:hypothetical protein
MMAVGASFLPVSCQFTGTTLVGIGILLGAPASWVGFVLREGEP